jgi:diguanylate cyclase (GGDEF)-like protein
MVTHPTPVHKDLERALALLHADGAAAARLAAQAAQAPWARAPDRALALVVQAIHELRAGSAADGLLRLAEAESLNQQAGPFARVDDLLISARAAGLRREGRPAEAEAMLEPLHRRASARPPVDAYLAASALGVLHSMRGHDLGALDLFYQALSLARRSGEPGLLVNALNNLGSYQSDLYNLDDAAPLLEECLEGALRLGSHRQIIFAAGNLVQCLCLMGQPARALALAREHLQGRIRADDPPALQRDEEMAQVLLDNGLVDDAAAVLARQPQNDPLSNEMATARVWLQARLLLTRGQPAEALQLCLRRRDWLDQTGEESTVALDRMNLHRVASQAAAELGNHALAYQLLQQAFATHEQLLGRAARSRHLSLQITHRLRQAEQERDSAQEMAARLGVLNTTLQAQVAENERLQAQLRAQALEDPLTGLHNRRHLMEAGAALLSLLRRRSEPLALVLIDLDHFKRVNDVHGHEAGDAVLTGFAELTRHETRAEDLACRYGGEEFVLLLPGAQAAQAASRMGSLLQKFQALRFSGNEGAAFGCSFSAGVAVSLGQEEALQALLARADAALYEAKQAGRGRVQMALSSRA